METSTSKCRSLSRSNLRRRRRRSREATASRKILLKSSASIEPLKKQKVNSLKGHTMHLKHLVILALGLSWLLDCQALEEAGHNHKLLKRRSLDEPLDDSIHPSEPHFERLIQAAQDEHQDTSRQASSSKKGNYRILYACEEKQMAIECQPGEFIQLVRANYGRYSIQICNDHGQLDWKVNCQSPSSFQTIANSCQAKQSCQLLASNSIFGDACPGTQKYLEVHYECVASQSDLGALNRTESGPKYQPVQHNSQPKTAKPNVIAEASSSSSSPPPPSPQVQQSETIRPQLLGPSSRWPTVEVAAPSTASPLVPLPPWLDAGVPNIRFSSSQTTTSNATGRPQCPEILWRQIRWPRTDAGQIAQAPCPPHAQAALTSEPQPASQACSPEARWTMRVRAPACQSLWLKAANQRLEAGDSPLSLMAELATRTRISPTAPSSGLFGDDLQQIASLVRRLVNEEMAELLNRIADDKQRLAFAREMVQLLVDLLNNLAHEQHSDAWIELEPIRDSSQLIGSQLSQSGERQRLSAQLMQSLEAATVLLAGTQSTSSLVSNHQAEGEFAKVTENVYLSIRPLSLQEASASNQTAEASFPSATSALATRWAEQKFTLRLQSANQPIEQLQQPTSQVDVKHLSDKQQAAPLFSALKIVFVMMRPLGRESNGQDNRRRLTVDSNLASLSIVGDSRYLKYAPVKMELTEPVELLFKHLSSASQRKQQPRCVYWDSNVSDWLSDGCRLVASNKTHSLCACNHLTTFALLAELDADDSATIGQAREFKEQKVQLDSVENEFILPNYQKSLYLAKMLDGHLFASGQQSAILSFPPADQPGAQQNARLAIYISCLLSATFLAVYLASVAYNQAHSRRLLGAIPAHPPPPLLVTSNNLNGNLRSQQQLIGASNSDETSPTYSSSLDYSAALNAATLAASYKSNNVKPQPLNFHQAPNNQAPSSSSFCYSRHHLKLELPLQIVLKLLCLQILIVLLVESQNYLQRNRHVAYLTQMSASFADMQLLLNSHQFLNPIGTITWILVGSLYFLVLSVFFWILAQLLSLTLRLLNWASPVQVSHKLKPTGRLQNLYGAPQHYSQTSTSPSSSFSSQSITDLASATYGQHMRLPTEAPNQKELFLVRLLRASNPIRLIDLLLVQVAPLLVAFLICLCASAPSQAFNSVTYTLTFGSQVACWPLLLELTIGPIASLIYYAPVICFSLVGLSLLALRQARQAGPARQAATDINRNGTLISRNMPLPEPQGSSASQHKSGGLANPYGSTGNSRQTFSDSLQLNKQSKCENKPNYNWQSNGAHLKQAKFLCALLSALAALHFLCWSSFLLHIHRVLTGISSTDNWLPLTFAGNNLLGVLILLASQRKGLKRSLQLAGLGRLLRAFRLSCSTSEDSYAANEPAALSLYGRAREHKVSPSNQSLFLVSQQPPTQQFYGNYHFHAPTYSAGSNQQPPPTHLYQQLAAGQQAHIYDSTSGLAGNHQDQRMAAMHRFQLDQQCALNRSMSSLPQAHQASAERAPMTLRPNLATNYGLDSGIHSCSRFVVLDAQVLKNQAGCPQQQHQQQQQQPQIDRQLVSSNSTSSGEADGPLVALSSSSASPPATFGPQAPQLPPAVPNLHQFPPLAATEHQLFSRPRDGCLHGRTCSTSGEHHLSSNLNEPLKQSMQQHNQLQQSFACDLHHFRRSNSRQQGSQRHQLASMIDRKKEEEEEENIYDVADLVLNN